MVPETTPGKPLDGQQASLKARQYFESIHGQFGVYNFRIVSVQRLETVWKVECSFSPSTVGYDTYRYQLEIDSISGEILEVSPVEARP